MLAFAPGEALITANVERTVRRTDVSCISLAAMYFRLDGGCPS